MVQRDNPYPRVAPERATARRIERDPEASVDSATAGTGNADNANEDDRRMVNPFSDAPSIPTTIGQDSAKSINRLPVPIDGPDASVIDVNSPATASPPSSTGVDERLDGQLSPTLQPPSIPDSFED